MFRITAEHNIAEIHWCQWHACGDRTYKMHVNTDITFHQTATAILSYCQTHTHELQCNMTTATHCLLFLLFISLNFNIFSANVQINSTSIVFFLHKFTYIQTAANDESALVSIILIMLH